MLVKTEAQDARFIEAGRRMRNGERGSEVLHDLFPAVRYVNVPRVMVTEDEHRCALVDEVGRRCRRPIEHEWPCVIGEQFEYDYPFG